MEFRGRKLVVLSRGALASGVVGELYVDPDEVVALESQFVRTGGRNASTNITLQGGKTFWVRGSVKKILQLLDPDIRFDGKESRGG